MREHEPAPPDLDVAPPSATHDPLLSPVSRAVDPGAMSMPRAKRGVEATGRTDDDDKRTIYVAMAANLVIAVTEAVAAMLTGSKAMLAESAHSLADTVDQIFLRVSVSRANRVADQKHPFGYGKERFFWAFLAAVFIFVTGSVISIAEGVRALVGGGHEVTRFGISYVVLGVGGVAQGISFVRASRQVRAAARAHGRGLLDEVRNTRNSTTKVVLVEDTADIVGIVLAFAGLALHQLTGDGRWDAVASVAIGVLLAYVAYALARDTKALLLGEAARPEEVALLAKVLAAHPEVDEVLAVLTMHTGPESLLVAVRVDLCDDLTGGEVEQLSDTIAREMQAAVPTVTEVFLDPTPAPVRP